MTLVLQYRFQPKSGEFTKQWSLYVSPEGDCFKHSHMTYSMTNGSSQIVKVIDPWTAKCTRTVDIRIGNCTTNDVVHHMMPIPVLVEYWRTLLYNEIRQNIPTYLHMHLDLIMSLATPGCYKSLRRTGQEWKNVPIPSI